MAGTNEELQDDGTRSDGHGPAHASRERLVRKLKDALGRPICETLDDPTVVEVMLNPDGRLFVERLGQGIEPLADPNAVPAEIVALAPADRMIILEDTAEIRCTAGNAVRCTRPTASTWPACSRALRACVGDVGATADRATHDRDQPAPMHAAIGEAVGSIERAGPQGARRHAGQRFNGAQYKTVHCAQIDEDSHGA